MNEQQPTQIQCAKSRIEHALLVLQGAPIPMSVGVPVTAALKVARNRIDRLETTLEEKFTIRDRFAMTTVAHLMVTGLYEPKEALELAYKLADEAVEVRRHGPL